MIWRQIPEFAHSKHAALMRKGAELQECKQGEESKQCLLCPQCSFYRFSYSGGHKIYIWWHRGCNGFVPLEKWRGLPGKLSLTVLWRGDKIIILSPGCPILYPGEPRDESDKGKGSNALSWPTTMFNAFCNNKVIPLSFSLQISIYMPCMLVVIAEISHHRHQQQWCTF